MKPEPLALVVEQAEPAPAVTRPAPPPGHWGGPRRVRPRQRWLVLVRRAALIALGLGGLLVMPQVVHRWLDTIGSAPVRSVGPLDEHGTPPAVGSTEFVRAMAALTATRLEPAHAVEIMTDGPAMLARLARDIRAARRSIAFQTYYCEPGRVADSLRVALSAKAREGVRVLFLRDGFGCASLGGAYSDSLRAAGVAVGTVRPVYWYSLHRAQHRSHVRAAVIDGEIAYTGGFGVADKWLLQPSGAPGWRETTVRFTGPAVQQLAGAFAVAWAEATGALLVGDGIFPAASPGSAAGTMAGLLYTTRSYGTPTPERYLALSLAGARHRIYITNAYFIPNRSLRQWLADAVRRDVDVRVLTASGNIDVQLTHWAARSHYAELLAAGVRLYEYQPAMLHAKTIVIDGVWASVGSLNLDNVSLRLNDEATLLVHDADVGARLDSIFVADLARSEEIDLERFRRRSWRERVWELAGRLFRDFL